MSWETRAPGTCRGFKVSWSLFLVAGVLASAVVPRGVAQQPAVDFKRDIEPILASRCHGCHGPALAGAQLRLDAKSPAMRGGLGGVVIQPGRGEESRLVRRILGAGGEQRMPLGRPPLDAQQVALIRNWIDQGAPWPEEEDGAATAGGTVLPKHWAFVAAQRPALPTVRTKSWPRTPVDAFILARLEAAGLSPSPEAGKSTLVRRLYLDLIGLPPSPKEVDEFLADTSPTAYEKLVEKLLASPHYGERWGRWWLDAARYADSNGFEKDRSRSIWPYRDWVIRSFNEDKPFDRFTVEQLAGDLMPGATLDSRVATGFLRNSMRNEEGGVDPEQFRVEEIVDRVDATGKAFLGLTVNCAQCHTHKFDPIRHVEYYGLYAFLNSDLEAELDVPSAAVEAGRAEIRRTVSRIEDELRAATPDLAERMSAWEERMRPLTGDWTVLEDTSVTASFGVKFERLPDHSFAARGDASTNNTYVVKARTGLAGMTAVRLEVMTDVSLPHGGPGRRSDGVAAVNELVVEVAPADSVAERPAGRRLGFRGASSDLETTGNKAALAVDGDNRTSWSTDTIPAERHRDRKLVAIFEAPVTLEPGAQLVFHLIQKHPDVGRIEFGAHPVIGRFRLSATAAPDPCADPLPARVRRLLSVPAAERSEADVRELFAAYRTTVPEWAAANLRIEALLRDWPYGDATLALMPRGVPRPTHVFRRGDWKSPEAGVVEPGTPEFLHPFPSEAPRNRLGLARWIVARDNPLTPRVIVNRIWQQYFGAGLVTTPEDLGTRSEPPSHPELLDWLAREFWDGGRRIKDVHRRIVNSATYRQSSTADEAHRRADGTNRLLGRAPRLRVEAETIRDIALAASGLLSRKVGGPSVFPPIPDGVLSLGYGAAMPWKTSTGEDRYRRGMYTFWKRNVPYPALQVFDMPNGDFACTRRLRSNTPLQALTSLNDATFVEAAQALALRVWREGGRDDTSRLRFAFRLCTGRAPDAHETRTLTELLRVQRAVFRGRTAAAVYVSSPDPNQLPEDVDLHEIAPWTIVARVLLNLDETITRD